MKKILLSLSLLLLAGTGCELLPYPEALGPDLFYPVADFEPTSGEGVAPDDLGEDTNGPWDRRMMIATSDDGLTWTRTNEIVADQANVPDMIMDENGWLWLYYIGWTVGDRQNTMAVAISTDQGETWVHKYVEFEGLTRNLSDPSVIYTDDGTFRMYGAYMDPEDGYISIHLAESTDGIHFAYVDNVFDPGSEANVPSVVDMGHWYQLFTSINYSNEGWLATSLDGILFENTSKGAFTVRGFANRFSNGLAVDGGVRVYMYDPTNGIINSAFTTDGERWVTDEDPRLEVDESSGLESDFVKDPAVVRLEDGSYLMVYVTVIP